MSESTTSSSTSTPTDTFHPFPKLPYELRHLIWSFILPRNRILHCRTNDDLETYLDRRRPMDEHLWLASPASAVPPITLSINKESRAHTLKRYTPLSAPYQNLRVDFENDLWWLEHRNRRVPDYTATDGHDIPDESHGLASSDKAKIRNLLIYDPNTRPSDIPLAISFWLANLGAPRGEGIRDVKITTQNLRLDFNVWAEVVDDQLSSVGNLEGWWERAREEFGEHVMDPRGVRLSYSEEGLRCRAEDTSLERGVMNEVSVRSTSWPITLRPSEE